MNTPIPLYLLLYSVLNKSNLKWRYYARRRLWVIIWVHILRSIYKHCLIKTQRQTIICPRYIYLRQKGKIHKNKIYTYNMGSAGSRELVPRGEK